MSKQIKQMEMDALKQTFQDVRDLVVLSVSGMSCQTDNQFRLTLRKKNIRLQVVKNSLTRRVFDELGFKVGADSPYWEGTTVLAWGLSSLAELSRELDGQLREMVKKNAALKDKVQFKGAIVEGQPIPFDRAKEMPTRAEAIGAIISAVLGPASQIVSQIMAPASQIAGQIQTLSERTPAEPAAEPVAEPAAG